MRTENSACPCNTGRPCAVYAPAFPHVDFSRVDPVWPDKTSGRAARYGCTRSAVVERGRLCLEALHSRPEKLVFVVSHAGFLRTGVVGHWFMNGDYRIFDFAQGASDGRRVLRQDASTVAGGLGLSLEESVPLGDGLPEH